MSYEFKFPDIGEGLTEGKILELKVDPGAEVTEGDILAIVETDKVVAEIASPKSGVIERFGVEEGKQIRVGETMAYINLSVDSIGSESTDKYDSLNPSSKPGEPSSETPKHEFQALVGTLDASVSSLSPSDEIETLRGSETQDENINEDSADRSPTDRGSTTIISSKDDPLVTPAARRRARVLNVDLKQVSPNQSSGRVTPEDVERAAAAGVNGVESQSLAAADPGLSDASHFAFPLIDDPLVSPSQLPLGETVELTILRKTIAHTMEISRKIPTATIYDVGSVDDLVELRTKVNKSREDRVSFQPFFMKSLATALRRYPVLNAHFDPVSEELTVFKDINIGVAVNTEAGLMIPVIPNVENKTIREIDEEMKEMVVRAKGRQIQIDDLRGGTFSLTNFGPFGGLYASPMIYPPQVAIIGAGRIHQAPTVVNGKVRPAWVLPVSLAFDHRVVDGVPAAEFASCFLELLRDPQELFVSM